jgi:hypothetical protein
MSEPRKPRWTAAQRRDRDAGLGNPVLVQRPEPADPPVARWYWRPLLVFRRLWP